MSTKVFCDRCGKELRGYRFLKHKVTIGEFGFSHSNYDICEKCYEDFKLFIKNQPQE